MFEKDILAKHAWFWMMVVRQGEYGIGEKNENFKKRYFISKSHLKNN